jgi:hypothetical protein
MKFKTLDQLKAYAEDMEQTEALHVGPSYCNHQRAVYQIGLIQILIDTVFPHNWFKPSQEWYWTGHYMTEEQANQYASKYNARVEDAYYTDIDEKQLMFDDLNDLLAWVFDHKRDELEKEMAV